MNIYKYIIKKIKKEFIVYNSFDFYGASYNLNVKNKFYSISWLHGWIFNDIKYPMQLISPEEVRSSLKFVWTDKQVEFLKKLGIKSYAVGAPFLYTSKIKQKKIYDLLIIPPHSINTKNCRDDIYEYLKNQNNNAGDSAVCLKSIDFKNKKLTKKIKKLGFNIVEGADISTEYGLQQIRNLFSSAKKIKTPVIGSHIVYALYCNTEVEIDFDNYISYTINEYKNHPYFKNKQFKTAIVYEVEQSDINIVREKFEFINNENIKYLNEWAKNELGQSCMSEKFINEKILKSNKFKNKIIMMLTKIYYKLIKL